MQQVVSAVTGEPIAALEIEDCRGLSKGTKAALGTEDWPPTLPTTALPGQLPNG